MQAHNPSSCDLVVVCKNLQKKGKTFHLLGDFFPIVQGALFLKTGE